jgi:hypothetical protein
MQIYGITFSEDLKMEAKQSVFEAEMLYGLTVMNKLV